MGSGHYGVMLFFMLSGFLMGFLYLDKPFDLCNVCAYARARIGRIVPLYTTMLILGYCVEAVLFGLAEERWMELILRLTYIDSSARLGRCTYHFWTIPVEVQFYIIFVGIWWIR